jgi:hypothetical protein
MIAPKTNPNLRALLIKRELSTFLKSSPLESDVTYLLSRFFETQLLLQDRLAAIFAKIYQQPDYDFMRIFKEIDRTSSGRIAAQNLQVFLNNAGVYSPNIECWLFRHFSSQCDGLDLNDFRRIFDVYGKGITGNGNKYSLEDENNLG